MKHKFCQLCIKQNLIRKQVAKITLIWVDNSSEIRLNSQPEACLIMSWMPIVCGKPLLRVASYLGARRNARFANDAAKPEVIVPPVIPPESVVPMDLKKVPDAEGKEKMFKIATDCKWIPGIVKKNTNFIFSYDEFGWAAFEYSETDSW